MHDVWTAAAKLMTSPWMLTCLQNIPRGMCLGAVLVLFTTVVYTIISTTCSIVKTMCCNRGGKTACKASPPSRARTPRASRAASVAEDIVRRLGGVVAEQNGVKWVHYHLTEVQKKVMKSLEFTEFWTSYAAKASKDAGVANVNINLYKVFTAY